MIEEVLGPRPVSTAVDVNHDQRTGRIAVSRIHAVDARLEQIGEVIPVIRQATVGP